MGTENAGRRIYRVGETVFWVFDGDPKERSHQNILHKRREPVWRIENCEITYEKASENNKRFIYRFPEKDFPTTEDEAIERFYKFHDKKDKLIKIDFKHIKVESNESI